MRGESQVGERGVVTVVAGRPNTPEDGAEVCRPPVAERPGTQEWALKVWVQRPHKDATVRLPRGVDPKRTKAAHYVNGVQKAPSCKVLSASDESGGKGPSDEGLVCVPEADLCGVGLWEPFAGPLKEASRHVLKARRVSPAAVNHPSLKPRTGAKMRERCSKLRAGLRSGPLGRARGCRGARCNLRPGGRA